MSRSYSTALAGLTFLLVSSTASVAQMRGEQCVPAVANPEMYRNCRLVIVRGNETCRCQILPQARRSQQVQDDNDNQTTSRGSPGSPGSIIGGPRDPGTGANPGPVASGPRDPSTGGKGGSKDPGGDTGGKPGGDGARHEG